MIKLVFLLAVIANLSYGQVPSSGPCPTNIPVKTPMSWAGYGGKWYTNQNTRSWMDVTGKCMLNTYNNLPTASATLTNFQYNITGTASKTETGTLSFPDPNKGEYMAKFPSAPFGQSLKVQIVDTDYSTCAVAYGCYYIPWENKKLEFVWVKSRVRIPVFGIGYCDTAIANTRVNRSLIIPVDQFNCPWDL